MVPLETEEYIIREVRKHWYFLLSRIMVTLTSTLFPLIAYAAISIFMNSSEYTQSILYTILILYPLWLVGAWISFFYFWTDYYLDVLIISNKRIINIDQQGMFNRKISSFPLEKIQDTTIEIRGFIATYLNFGNVTIQTASEQIGFMIENAKDPELVKEIIQEAHDNTLKALRIKNV